MTATWFGSLISAVAFVGVSFSSAAPAFADQAAPNANGPGVARVSIVQGSVVVQRGDSKKQVAAVVNAPLLPGDYISTGPSSRAEVQFDGYTAVRLGGGVQARITSNDPNDRQLQLADGTIEVALVQDDGPIEIETPSVTVSADDKGAYRITINKDGSTWVTARHGRADVQTPQKTYTLDPGKTLVARGSASTPSVAYTSEVGYDSFDDFNAKRDSAMLAAVSDNPGMNPSIAGYDNLDAYGQWQNVSGYGQVWVPNEPSGWAPYRNGSWVWEGGYGWTWVGNEPWGWAPYHYGRWFWANGYGWAWYPPAAYPAPVWSPALVGFFGWGGGGGWGLSVGFNFGGIGWCPLAPYEPYYAWAPGWGWNGYGWGWRGYGGYGYGGYGWGTHVVNITKITNIYKNSGHHGSTGTIVGNFTKGDFQHNIALDSKQLARTGQVRGALPVTPGTRNLSYSGTSLTHQVPLSSRFQESRFASNRAIASRAPFSQQRKAVSEAIHAPSNGHVTATSTRHDAPVTAHANAPVTAHANTPVTARANTPVTRENAAGHTVLRNDSWQRFDTERGASAVRGNAVATHPEAFNRAADTMRAPTDSWSRFSHERGNVSFPRSSYGRDSYGRGSYGRDSYGRDSYGRDSYGRGSYGRDSYPSYSRGTYQSAPRASYPSYSRGSYSAPRSSGGGARSGGGGGGGRGGRPPRS